MLPYTNPVRLLIAGEQRNKKAMLVPPGHGPQLVSEHQLCRLGLRQERPHLPAALAPAFANQVRPQDPEGIAVVTADYGFDVRTGHASLYYCKMTGWHELPKAELHVHLEGSLTQQTMRGLAPEISMDEIRARYSFTNFLGFLECFGWVVKRIRTPDDYAL